MPNPIFDGYVQTLSEMVWLFPTLNVVPPCSSRIWSLKAHKFSYSSASDYEREASSSGCFLDSFDKAILSKCFGASDIVWPINFNIQTNVSGEKQ